MATIFKFKMAAGYHVDSDGYPGSYYFIYIKLQVCQCWCFYHKMHNPSKKYSLAAVLHRPAAQPAGATGLVWCACDKLCWSQTSLSPGKLNKRTLFNIRVISYEQ